MEHERWEVFLPLRHLHLSHGQEIFLSPEAKSEPPVSGLGSFIPRQARDSWKEQTSQETQLATYYYGHEWKLNDMR